MNFSTVKYMMCKEFARVFKDKKLVFSLFIMPALLIVVIYSLIGVITDMVENDIKDHEAIVFIQNAPEEVKGIISATGYGQMSNVTYLTADATSVDGVKEAILEGDADLLVIFEDGFAKKVSSYESGAALPKVTVCYNSTKNYSANAQNVFAMMVLDTYKTSILSSRYDLNAIKCFDLTNVQIVDEDQAKGQSLALMLPYLITFLIYASAMSIVMDAVAGEKERGTMSRLLLTPAGRSDLALGKLAALTVLTLISAAVYALSMVLVMPKLMGPLFGGDGSALHFSAYQIVSIFLLLMLLAYLYVAIIAFCSIMAKDAKEASSFVTPIYMVVLLAAMSTMLSVGQDMASFLHVIPVYGTALSIQKLLVNDLSVIELFLSLAGNLVFAAVFTGLVTKAFNSEKVMFNA